MRFVDGSAVPFKHPGTSHREGNIEFRYLLNGQEGSPQNYELVVTKTTGRFFTGAHRHNFDQIRVVLSGNFRDQTGKLTQNEGDVVYYPEAVPYEIDSGDTVVLLLQFGGASGNGFTPYDRLREAYPEVAKKGEFKDGIFRWHEPPEGGPKQQDSYEALWEHIHGKSLTYPKPRFRHAVAMNPEAFDWTPMSEKGVQERELGHFTERHIVIAQVRLQAGAQSKLRAPDTVRLFYVLEGTGRAAEHALKPGSTFELVRGDELTVSATDPLLLVAFDLPHFETSPPATAVRGTKVAEGVA